MKKYILDILLKHPRGRSRAENNTLVMYVDSVKRVNSNWKQELDYFNKIETLFDNYYKTI